MTAFLRVNEDGHTRDVAVIPPGRMLVIGRSEESDVPFPFDSLMSSRHLSIELKDDQCLICDLGSTNGTTVNGENIQIAKVTQGVFEDFTPLRGQVMPLRTVYLDAIEGGRVEKPEDGQPR